MNPAFIDEMSFRMSEVYGAVTDRILVNLARHFQFIKDGAQPSGGWDYQVRKLAEMGQVTKETEQIILESLGDADGALQGLLDATITKSLKKVETPLRKAAERGLLNGGGNIPPEVSANQTQAFQAFYQQSADKLNLVNTVMLESTQQAYVATVSDIATRMNAVQGILNTETGGVVSGVTTLNQAIRSGVQRMIQNGITGYIDHGGHHWSPEAYVAMDVRTTMANASRAAVWERQEQYGSDLYQVSWHNGARPLCYPWQGKVISRDDLVRDVEDDEGNTVHVYAQSETTYGQPAGLFGINCKHYPIPFFPGFSRLRPPEQDEEANAKEYAESQEQRRLEREYRYAKRDLAVAKARGDEELIATEKGRVKSARQNLDNFCEETGRARRTGREGTPIKATFPDTDSYNVSGFKTDERDKIREFFNGGNSSNKGTPEIKFTPAKTIAEAEEEFSRMVNPNQFGAIGVSYKGISLDVANEINRTIGSLYDEFNVPAFGGIQAPTANTKLGKALSTSTAGYIPIRNSFALNRKSLATMETAKAAFASEGKALTDILSHPERYDFSKLSSVTRGTIERAKVSGRATVPQTIEEALTHEFGHALEKQVKKHSGWSVARERMSIYADYISGYAGANESEYIAESFTSYRKGENICDPLLITIFESLKR